MIEAYTQEFDQEAYQSINPDSTKRQELDSYTSKQVETLLAERFNVLLNTYGYESRGGVLFGQNMNEPALESFRRGRDYRKKVGNPIDFDRENAEIVGFEKTEKMLSEGKTVLSISPKGKEESTYQHNFYDVFTPKGGKIEARRYSSALSLDDYRERLGLVGEISDVALLANPIDISNAFESADELHKYLHKEHEYMNEEVFKEYILSEVAPFITNYLRALAYDGEAAQQLALNAVLNVADEAARRQQSGTIFGDKIKFSSSSVIDWGTREVRETTGGCGSSGGFGAKNASPFSVSEFGGNEWFQCPKCEFKANGPVGDACPGCGLTKEAYLEESGAEAC